MDDSYCIALDKQTLWDALSRIEALCDDLGIIINRKKTRVVKLSRGFVFLKKRFSYGEGEKVVVRPCRSSVTRQRRKLKKQAALVGSRRYDRRASQPVLPIVARRHEAA